jgi:hypothetical protein
VSRRSDPVARRARASRHAQRSHYCSCGKIVRGNGGEAAHKEMHLRRQEWRVKEMAWPSGMPRAESVAPTFRGHTYVTVDAFRAFGFKTRWDE